MMPAFRDFGALYKYQSKSGTFRKFFCLVRIRGRKDDPMRTHLSCTTLKKYLLDYDHSIGGLVAEMLLVPSC